MTITVVSGQLRKLTSDERAKSPYKYMVLSQFTFTDTDFERRGIASDALTTRERSGSAHFFVRVPAGFLTDGASAGAPDLGASWVFHDWLYAKHAFTSGQPCTRAQADKVMDEVLRHDRMNFYAWGFTKLAKLNPFWGFSKAWKRSGTRGAEFLGRYEEPRSLPQFPIPGQC